MLVGYFAIFCVNQFQAASFFGTIYFMHLIGRFLSSLFSTLSTIRKNFSFDLNEYPIWRKRRKRRKKKKKNPKQNDTHFVEKLFIPLLKLDDMKVYDILYKTYFSLFFISRRWTERSICDTKRESFDIFLLRTLQLRWVSCNISILFMLVKVTNQISVNLLFSQQLLISTYELSRETSTFCAHHIVERKRF